MSRPGGLWGLRRGRRLNRRRQDADGQRKQHAEPERQPSEVLEDESPSWTPGVQRPGLPVCRNQARGGATPIDGREMGRRWEAAETSPALSLSWPADTLLAFTVAGEWRGKRPELRPSPAGPRFTRTSQPPCGKRPAPAGEQTPRLSRSPRRQPTGRLAVLFGLYPTTGREGGVTGWLFSPCP